MHGMAEVQVKPPDGEALNYRVARGHRLEISVDDEGGWTILVGHRVTESGMEIATETIEVRQPTVVRTGRPGRPRGSKNVTRPVDRRKVKGPLGLNALGDLLRESNGQGPTSNQSSAERNVP